MGKLLDLSEKLKDRKFYQRVDRVYDELVEEARKRKREGADFPRSTAVKIQLRRFAEKLCAGMSDDQLKSIKNLGGYFDAKRPKPPETPSTA